MSILKNCPLCDSKATTTPASLGEALIICSNGECNVKVKTQGYTDHEAKDNAIRKWNHRPEENKINFLLSMAVDEVDNAIDNGLVLGVDFDFHETAKTKLGRE